MQKISSSGLHIQDVLNIVPQSGTVQWIGIRPARNAPVEVVASVQADIAEGLIGDHYSKSNGNRQVTLIQAEHLEVVAKILGRDQLSPELLRRNIVVAGINLLALQNRQFSIGEVILETTGLCHPCTKMETLLGPGGYNALRGHGGITAKVVQVGTIQLGDSVRLLLPS